MNKNVLYVICTIVLVIIVLATIFALRQNKTANPAPVPTTVTQTMGNDNQATGSSQNGFKQQEFQNIKTPHFISSQPANNALLEFVPDSVVISFNFDLTSPSEIRVTTDGQDITFGETKISDDKLSMSVPIEAVKGSSSKVEYTACWPDGSCHDGSFGFSVKP